MFGLLWSFMQFCTDIHAKMAVEFVTFRSKIPNCATFHKSKLSPSCSIPLSSSSSYCLVIILLFCFHLTLCPLLLCHPPVRLLLTVPDFGILPLLLRYSMCENLPMICLLYALQLCQEVASCWQFLVVKDHLGSFISCIGRAMISLQRLRNVHVTLCFLQGRYAFFGC